MCSEIVNEQCQWLSWYLLGKNKFELISYGHIISRLFLGNNQIYSWNSKPTCRVKYFPWPVKVRKWKSLSHLWLFATPWTVVCQAPLSMEFSRILEWVAYPFSRGLSQPWNQTRSPALQAGSLPAELPGKPLAHELFLYYDFLFVYFCFGLKVNKKKTPILALISEISIALNTSHASTHESQITLGSVNIGWLSWGPRFMFCWATCHLFIAFAAWYLLLIHIDINFMLPVYY